jgi:hypothetical protein
MEDMDHRPAPILPVTGATGLVSKGTICLISSYIVKVALVNVAPCDAPDIINKTSPIVILFIILPLVN